MELQQSGLAVTWPKHVPCLARSHAIEESFAGGHDRAADKDRNRDCVAVATSAEISAALQDLLELYNSGLSVVWPSAAS